MAETPEYYVHRGTTVEAIQWTGDNWDEVQEFLDVPKWGRGATQLRDPDKRPVLVKTPDGSRPAHIGDYIVLVSPMTFVPVSRTTFEKIYEPAEEDGYDADEIGGTK